jgi:hypothetical protein
MTDCFSKDALVGLYLHVLLPQAPLLSTFLRCVWPLPLFPSIHGRPSKNETRCHFGTCRYTVIRENVFFVHNSTRTIFFKCSFLLHGPLLFLQGETWDLVTRVLRSSGKIANLHRFCRRLSVERRFVGCLPPDSLNIAPSVVFSQPKTKLFVSTVSLRPCVPQ